MGECLRHGGWGMVEGAVGLKEESQMEMEHVSREQGFCSFFFRKSSWVAFPGQHHAASCSEECRTCR